MLHLIVKSNTIRSVAGGGGATHLPLNLLKGPLLATKCAGKKWGICKRVKGGKFQTVHFLGLKGPHSRGFGPAKKSFLATGLNNNVKTLQT